MTSPRLSKSKIAAFEQCPKRLWLQVYEPGQAEFDEDRSLRLETGIEVGEIAQGLVEGGRKIVAEPDLRSAIDKTSELTASDDPIPLFEATFEHEGVLVRADILEPDGDGGWQLAEVKSSTRVKDYHVGDIATQLWVLAGVGLKISRSCIRHIDNQFTLENLGSFEGLFKDGGPGEEVSAIVEARADTVSAAKETLSGEEPAINTGGHCKKPFDCEFHSYCVSNEAPAIEWPISELPQNGAAVAVEWAERGVFDIRDIPDGALEKPVHERIRAAVVSGEPYHDVDAIRSETQDWAYPRIFLDFETIAPAVPLWVGTRPYEQIPFQFSAHVQLEDGTVEHVEFLDLSGEDPRLACAEALARLPGEGAVCAWFARFERSCLNLLADAHPEHKGALHSLADRLVDLLPVTRRHYYHPDQRGSWSLKAVLPTLVPDLDYSDLAVRDGNNAQLAYVEATDPSCSAERRAALDVALREYCGRDTWAMVELLRHLAGRGS